MNIKDFFVEPIPEEKEVLISKRFPKFKIKSITEAEMEDIRKSTLKPVKKNGVTVGSEMDNAEFTRACMVACTVVPDFSDAELCKFYKVLDPLEVPGKMLSPGEYQALSHAISEILGFGDAAETENEYIEETAKN